MMPDLTDPTLSRTYWDEAADMWDHFVESGLDYFRTELHGPALTNACGAVADLAALDLGCGQGWFSRELARRGARVVGVDWSERLIDHARGHEARAPLGVQYLVYDAAEVADHLRPRRFALITACMSLMDMPYPDRVLAAARTLLADGGRLVLSVPNPVTDSSYRAWERDAEGRKLALKIDRYFDADTHLMDWTMPRLPRPFRTIQYRHTLEAWSHMFEAAGLVIRRLREPQPSPAVLARTPQLISATRLPFFLIFELVADGERP